MLEGAKSSINHNHPIMMIEIIKSDQSKIENLFLGIGLLAIHRYDPVLKNIKFVNGILEFTR